MLTHRLPCPDRSCPRCPSARSACPRSALLLTQRLRKRVALGASHAAQVARETLPILLCVKNVGPEQASVMAMLVEPHDDAALGLLCSDALGRVATQELRRIDAREPDRLLHVGAEAQT